MSTDQANVTCILWAALKKNNPPQNTKTHPYILNTEVGCIYTKSLKNSQVPHAKNKYPLDPTE